MSRTISEQLFEDYCAARGIVCARVAESTAPTPDYELQCGEQRIVVEVKEITPNKEEQESERLALERGYGNVVSHTPGDRVRRKISDCSPQVKARTLGTLPSILVVFDRGRVASHVDPYNIRVAMYGLEQVYIAVPPIGAGSPYATGMGYGPMRKMGPEHNTSISAIGALVMTGPTDVFLRVFHNRFAHVRLDPALLGSYGVEQFELGDDPPGTTAQWQPISSARGRHPAT